MKNNLKLLEQLQNEVANKGKTAMMPKNLSRKHLEALLQWIDATIQLREIGEEPNPWIDEIQSRLLRLLARKKELSSYDEVPF